MVLENSVDHMDYKTDQVYSGTLEGFKTFVKKTYWFLDDREARIHEILDADGVFDGHVDAHDDIFVIELSKK